MRFFTQKLMIKLTGLCFAVLAAGPAAADQCSYVSLNAAIGATELIKIGSYVMHHCEPCGNLSKKTELVTEINYAMVKSPFVPPGQYYQVSINGNPVDLAYLFWQTKGQMADDDFAVFTNVSKMVGCASTDVSSFLQEREHTDHE